MPRFEVEDVKEVKNISNKTYFLVKWKGYSSVYNSWINSEIILEHEKAGRYSEKGDQGQLFLKEKQKKNLRLKKFKNVQCDLEFSKIMLCGERISNKKPDFFEIYFEDFLKDSKDFQKKSLVNSTISTQFERSLEVDGKISAKIKKVRKKRGKKFLRKRKFSEIYKSEKSKEGKKSSKKKKSGLCRKRVISKKQKRYCERGAPLTRSRSKKLKIDFSKSKATERVTGFEDIDSISIFSEDIKEKNLSLKKSKKNNNFRKTSENIIVGFQEEKYSFKSEKCSPSWKEYFLKVE